MKKMSNLALNFQILSDGILQITIFRGRPAIDHIFSSLRSFTDLSSAFESLGCGLDDGTSGSLRNFVCNGKFFFFRTRFFSRTIWSEFEWGRPEWVKAT
jgi:hypothetical protein